MQPVILDAPIKINLALHIIGQEASRYHLLQTLVVFASEGDKISVAASVRDEVNIEGVYGHGLSKNNDNLIVKARDALRSVVGVGAFPVTLKLRKNLPVASGLGGGSADAAATLLALSQLWGQGYDILDDLARNLGADVLMCLHALQHGQALLATNIGDKIEPLSHFPALDMVIVNPVVPLSTSAVFAALVKKDNPPFTLMMDAITSVEQLVEALTLMRNDLYVPASTFVPQIRRIVEELQQAGAMFARMSGSGASCFGIYASRDKAQQSATILKQQYPDYFIQAVRTMGR